MHIGLCAYRILNTIGIRVQGHSMADFINAYTLKMGILSASLRNTIRRAAAVAKLAEELLPTPEDTGSNLAMSNFYKEHVFTVNF